MSWLGPLAVPTSRRSLPASDVQRYVLRGRPSDHGPKDERGTAGGSRGRDALLLRLPASLLASLTDYGCRLVLQDERRGAGAAERDAKGAAAAVVSVVRGGGAAEEAFSAAAVDAGVADVYVPPDTPLSAASAISVGNELRRVGSTARRRYSVHPTAQLREVGRKLRQRLEEEKGKRKEIVRIDDDVAAAADAADDSFFPVLDVAAPTKKRSRSSGVNGAAGLGKSRMRKRRAPARPSAKRGGGGSAGKIDGGTAVDSWSPDVSALSCRALPKERRSNVVRVHGLPLGSRPEHVRKFFSGLDPERVFALPSHESPIADFDASPEEDSRGASCVNRHDRTFRVFVKFKSIPVADMAVGRSGEAIHMMISGPFGGKQLGAAVAVTPVSKSMANFFQSHMAIDGVKGECIHSTVSKTEEQLHPVVTKTLWVMAGRAIGLAVSLHALVGPHGMDQSTSMIFEEWRHLGVPTDAEAYRRLARKYNALWDMHEHLELESTPILLHEYDPGAGDDAVIKLSSVASDWFLDEMEKLRQVLCQSRGQLIT